MEKHEVAAVEVAGALSVDDRSNSARVNEINVAQMDPKHFSDAECSVNLTSEIDLRGDIELAP